MRIADMTWLQVEQRVKTDDRCVLPLGSVEQHAYLSLCVDQILSEKVSVDAAEPLGVPVYPAVPFGLTPYFSDFPGTVSLRVSTYMSLIEDILDEDKTPCSLCARLRRGVLYRVAKEVGATKIALYGVDMAANDEYGDQRSGLHYFAMLARAPAPGPRPVAIGIIAATSITVVIRIGRNRASFAFRMAASRGSPFATRTFV